ncbi:YhgE/Pip domain-containing protein [Effusibacillus pohliae]|uniref:YhgE/Pip domain-containing protein n=1 Tax=Effusibacillus pohliae TaxID=232270 RepID=UPI000382AFB2|nr:YhgE/Pip domain-containing protein [Effusibacillus pohliae]
MDGLRVAKYEWRAIFRNPKAIISIIALLLVPLLYSYLYLWAFWDPYERLDHLPVAVVNQDQGAEMDGKPVNIGQELVDKLKSDPKLKWEFTSYEKAREGLENQRYYMMVQIPADFSKKAASLSQTKPQQAEILFVPNESRNLLASQLGARAMEEMRAQIQRQLTEKYAEVLFEKLGDTGKGLADAAFGAYQLSDGLLTVKQGTVQLHDGAGKLSSGARQLNDGAQQLYGGLQSLESGLKQASDGSARLAAGLAKLNDKGKELSQGAGQLAAGLQPISQAIARIAPDLQQTSTGLKQLAPVAGDTLTQWQALVAKHPELLQDPEGQKLARELGEISQTVPKAAAASEQIATALNQAAPGVARLAAGSQQLASGVEQYVTGVGQAKDGAQQVAEGFKRLYEGAGKLTAGAANLAAGSGSLAVGGTTLQNGVDRLASGVVKLADGSKELASKLAEGSQQVNDGIADSKDKANMIAEPVQLEENKLHPVPNYGTGFSPYFISLALYVGALLLFIILDVRRVAVQPKRATAWLFGKFSVYAAIGVLQALIVGYSLQAGLGLQVVNQPMFYAMCMLISVTFVVLIQGLITVFGEAGRFLAIVILMLQLTSSAGTFPLEMTPEFFQSLNPYLPMTYTVAGLKAVISNGDSSWIWANVRTLALFTIGVAVVTVLLSLRRYPGAKTKSVAESATA